MISEAKDKLWSELKKDQNVYGVGTKLDKDGECIFVMVSKDFKLSIPDCGYRVVIEVTEPIKFQSYFL